MPRYLINGQSTTEAAAHAHIHERAYAAGMDPAETAAYITRAHADDEDGEEARDSISSFAPDIEILI